MADREVRINIESIVDFSQLDALINKITEVQTAFAALGNNRSKRGMNKTEDAAEDLKNTVEDVTEAVQEMDKALTGVGKTRGMTQATNVLEDIGESAQEGTTDIKKMSKAMTGLDRVTDGLTGEMRDLAKIAGNSFGVLDKALGLQRKSDQLEEDIEDIAEAATKAARSFAPLTVEIDRMMRGPVDNKLLASLRKDLPNAVKANEDAIQRFENSFVTLRRTASSTLGDIESLERRIAAKRKQMSGIEDRDSETYKTEQRELDRLIHAQGLYTQALFRTQDAQRLVERGLQGARGERTQYDILSRGLETLTNKSEVAAVELRELTRVAGNSFTALSRSEAVATGFNTITRSIARAGEEARETFNRFGPLRDQLDQLQSQQFVPTKMIDAFARQIPSAMKTAESSIKTYRAQLDTLEAQQEKVTNQIRGNDRSIRAAQELRGRQEPETGEYRRLTGEIERFEEANRELRIENGKVATSIGEVRTEMELLGRTRDVYGEMGDDARVLRTQMEGVENSFKDAFKGMDAETRSVRTNMSGAATEARKYAEAMELVDAATQQLTQGQARLNDIERRGTMNAGDQQAIEQRLSNARSKSASVTQTMVNAVSRLTGEYAKLDTQLGELVQRHQQLTAGVQAGAIDANAPEIAQATQNIQKHQQAMQDIMGTITQYNAAIQSSRSVTAAAEASREQYARSAQQIKIANQAATVSFNQLAAAIAGAVSGHLRSLGNGLQNVSQMVGNFGRNAQQAFSGLQRALQGTVASFLGIGRAARTGFGQANNSVNDFLNGGWQLIAAGHVISNVGQAMFRGVEGTLRGYMDYERSLTRTAISAALPQQSTDPQIQAQIDKYGAGTHPEFIEDLIFGLQRGDFYQVPGGPGERPQSVPINISAQELAQGLYYYTSAIGMPVTPDNYQTVGPLVAQIMAMASATQTGVETATKGVVNIAQEFGIDVRGAMRGAPGTADDLALLNKIPGQMAYLANISTMEVPDIAETFKMLGPMAHILSGNTGQAGAGLTEMMALTYMASDMGLRGGNVGRGLGQMFTTLEDPTDKLIEDAGQIFPEIVDEETFRNFFFDAEDNLKGGLKGLFETFHTAVGEGTGNDAAELLAKFFTQNATRSMVAVVEGWLRKPDTFDDIVAQLNSDEPQKFLNDAILATDNTIGGNLQYLRNAWFATTTEIINAISGPLKAAFKGIGDVFWEVARVFNDNPFLGRFVAAAAAAVASLAALAGGFLTIAGSTLLLARAFSMMGAVAHPFFMLMMSIPKVLLFLSPILLGLAAAAAVLYGAWKTNFMGIQDLMKGFQDSFSFEGDILPRLVALADGALMAGRAFSEAINYIVFGTSSLKNLTAVFGHVLGPLLGGTALSGIIEMARAFATVRFEFMRFLGGLDGDGVGNFFDDLGLAAQGFFENLLFGFHRVETVLAINRLGEALGISGLLDKLDTAADGLRNFLVFAQGVGSQLNDMLAASFGEIGENISEAFSGENLDAILRFVGVFTTGVFAGLAGTIIGVVEAIEAISEAALNLGSAGEAINDFTEKWFNFGTTANEVALSVGALVGGVLGARIISTFLPLGNLLANATVMMLRFGVAAGVAAVQAGLFATRMLLVGVAGIAATGPFGLLVVGILALGAAFAAFIAKTYGFDSLVVLVTRFVDGFVAGAGTVINIIGTLGLALYKIVDFILPLEEGFSGLEQAAYAFGVVAAVAVGAWVLSLAKVPAALNLLGNGIVKLATTFAKTGTIGKVAMLGIGVGILLAMPHMDALIGAFDKLNEATGGWVDELALGWALLGFPGLGALSGALGRRMQGRAEAPKGGGGGVGPGEIAAGAGGAGGASIWRRGAGGAVRAGRYVGTGLRAGLATPVGAGLAAGTAAWYGSEFLDEYVFGDAIDNQAFFEGVYMNNLDVMYASPTGSMQGPVRAQMASEGWDNRPIEEANAEFRRRMSSAVAESVVNYSKNVAPLPEGWQQTLSPVFEGDQEMIDMTIASVQSRERAFIEGMAVPGGAAGPLSGFVGGTALDGYVAPPTTQGASDAAVKESNKKAKGWIEGAVEEFNKILAPYGIDLPSWSDITGIDTEMINVDKLLEGTPRTLEDEIKGEFSKQHDAWMQATRDYQDYTNATPEMKRRLAKYYQLNEGGIPGDPGDFGAYLQSQDSALADANDLKARIDLNRQAAESFQNMTVEQMMQGRYGAPSFGVTDPRGNIIGVERQESVGTALLAQSESIIQAARDAGVGEWFDQTELLMDAAVSGANLSEGVAGQNLKTALAPSLSTTAAQTGVPVETLMDNIQTFVGGEEYVPTILGDMMSSVAAQDAVTRATLDTLGAGMYTAQGQLINEGKGLDWAELMSYGGSMAAAGQDWNLIDYIQSAWGWTRAEAQGYIQANGIDPGVIGSAVYGEGTQMALNSAAGTVSIINQETWDMLAGEFGDGADKFLEVTQAEFDQLDITAKQGLTNMGYSFVITAGTTGEQMASAIDAARETVGNTFAKWESITPGEQFGRAWEDQVEHIIQGAKDLKNGWTEITTLDGTTVTVPTVEYQAWLESVQLIKRENAELRAELSKPFPTQSVAWDNANLFGGAGNNVRPATHDGAKPAVPLPDFVNVTSTTVMDLVYEWGNVSGPGDPPKPEEPKKEEPRRSVMDIVYEWGNIIPPGTGATAEQGDGTGGPRGWTPPSIPIIPPPPAQVIDIPIIWNPVVVGAGGHREAPSLTPPVGTAPAALPAAPPAQAAPAASVAETTVTVKADTAPYDSAVAAIDGQPAGWTYLDIKENSAPFYAAVAAVNGTMVGWTYFDIKENSAPFYAAVAAVNGTQVGWTFLNIQENSAPFYAAVAAVNGTQVGWTYLNIQENSAPFYAAVAAINGTQVGWTYMNIQENSAPFYAAIAAINGQSVGTVYIDVVRRDVGGGGGVASAGGFQMLASGGRVKTRYQLVGEEGPELVSLPYGSYVHSATDTIEMMQRDSIYAAMAGNTQEYSSGGGGGDNVTLHIDNITISKEADLDAIVARVDRMLGGRLSNVRRGMSTYDSDRTV